ncbi:DUF2380 domain-containing protein [Methylomicrobium lacus]|uniref:DUF2380 domain-containing protein n=1 Tax=Methylomicrobium lacus TaxID=136992 RepID=UPI0035A87E50
MRRHKPASGCLLAFLLLFAVYSSAAPRIAVLDFELKDLTPAPSIPAEVARTASIKPLLEQELAKAHYPIVQIDRRDIAEAAAGPGYLFNHHDLAAELGRTVGADYVVVGRLHKPSYLFAYLMAHLVDVRQGKLIGDYISEIKGGDKKLTLKGVESLARKITATLAPDASRSR